MAHKVLSSDMAELITAMKMAQQYSSTLLDGEYRKGMLKAAHVLAMDSKNLLDAVDSARKKMIASQQTDSEVESEQVDSNSTTTTRTDANNGSLSEDEAENNVNVSEAQQATSEDSAKLDNSTDNGSTSEC